jgi:hypothetical protein
LLWRSILRAAGVLLGATGRPSSMARSIASVLPYSFLSAIAAAISGPTRRESSATPTRWR